MTGWLSYMRLNFLPYHTPQDLVSKHSKGPIICEMNKWEWDLAVAPQQSGY